MNEPIPNAPVWLITGCSTGFGRALAGRALALGSRVVATARQPDALADLPAQFPETCRTLELDVTDVAQVQSVVAEAAAAFGQLDVVVNNAGYALAGAFEELSAGQIRRNFETNFFGALEVIRAALPILRQQRSGHLVNISAAAVIANYAGFSIYGASKSALEAVSESLAIELKPLGIKVTIVEPGPHRTDFNDRSLDRGAVSMAEYEPTSGKFLTLLERMAGKQPGDPEKAADAIIAAVNAPAPPLRLVLGKYAHEKARNQFAVREKERASWEQIGLATDFAAR